MGTICKLWRELMTATLLCGCLAPALAAFEPLEAVVERNYYVDESVAAVHFLLPAQPAEAELQVRTTVTLPAGEPLIVSAQVEQVPGLTTLYLPLTTVPLGSFTTTLQLLAGDRVIWTGEDRLVRRPSPPAGVRVVQIDRYRLIPLIDGEPWFPLGIIGVWQEHLQQVADAGFDLTMRWKGTTTSARFQRGEPYDSPTNRAVVNEYLDAVQAAGMYALESPVKLVEEDMYMRYRDPDWHEKYPVVNQEIVPGIVKLARRHPAVVGYYSYDEPDNFYPRDPPDSKRRLLMQEGVEQFYHVVHELDPYHLVVTLFAVGLQKVQDWQAWDMPARDFYINDSRHMSLVYERARESALVAQQRRSPLLFTPLFEESSAQLKPISPEAQRAQTYLGVIGDARGLLWWDWPAAYAPNWQMLQQLIGELRELRPILVERTPVHEVSYPRAGSERSVKLLVKAHDGKVYLIAANTEYATVETTIRLPAGITGPAQVWFDERELTVENQTLQDTLEPYGRRVYELQGEWPYGGTVELSLEVGEDVKPRDVELTPTEQNLVINGSFEHDYATTPGWPIGWHQADSVMQAGVVGEPGGPWNIDATTAWHGERSLRLERTEPGRGDGNDAFNFATAPATDQRIHYPSAGTYTCSLYLKANRPALVWLMLGWGNLHRLEVSTQWQRYSVTYDAQGGNSFIRLYIMDQGKLWIDAVHVAPGKGASAYGGSSATGK